MKIQVNKKYAINVANDGFTLVKLSVVKEGENAGKINESFAGYWPKVEQLAHHILINELAESKGSVAIGELAQAFEDAAQKISKSIKEICNDN